jgi:hypothetical protein
MFFPATESVEDGVVKVFEGLVTPNLNGAADHRILLGELLGAVSFELVTFDRLSTF